MKNIYLVVFTLLLTTSCAFVQKTKTADRNAASVSPYVAKLCFSNQKEFSGDESYCSLIDKVKMESNGILIADSSDKACKIDTSIMPIGDLGEIKKSLEARQSTNYLICVTSSHHIHTDRDATNVLYIAEDFNWYSRQ